MPRLHRKKCPVIGKVRFAIKSHVLNQIAIARKFKGISLEYYKCPHCRDFHLTKSRRASCEEETLQPCLP